MLHGMQANHLGLRVNMEMVEPEIGIVEKDRCGHRMRVRRLVDKKKKPMYRLQEQPMYRQVEIETPMYRRVIEKQPMYRLEDKEVDQRLNRRVEPLRKDLDQAGHTN